MNKICGQGIGKRRIHRLCLVFVTAAAAVVLLTAGGCAGNATGRDAARMIPERAREGGMRGHLPADENGKEKETADREAQISGQRDLTEAFNVILQGATKEFIAGYPIDKAFLMWLHAWYGEEAVLKAAYAVLDKDMDPEIWYQATGCSIHVLWTSYCECIGYQNETLENVRWIDCQSEEEVVISFTGDFNFAKDWCTTKYMDSRPNGIYDCFSKELLEVMNESDLLMMNNEFAYSDRGEPLYGKGYTFRAEPERAKLLSAFGVDIVSLANNHVYDYGEDAFRDTLEILKELKITYVGAGKNLKEASRIVYYVANGRKIAIVSATQIERYSKFTKEATEDGPGVLKTLYPERFLAVIREARANSDYVLVIPHWGAEGVLYPDQSQRTLAAEYAEAGADAVIGGHPHRLQGIGFIKEIPVAYSIGNFWFSDAALYTTVAQVVIQKDGELRLRFLPCVQKNLTTSLITDKTEIDDFYNYLAAISTDIGIDAEGKIYSLEEETKETEIVYDSAVSTTPVIGGRDLEGNAIDHVGNLK